MTMDTVVKAKPVWDEYFDRWILSQQVSIYGEHELDYACRYDTLETIEKVPNALFVFDKDPVYESKEKWINITNFWILRKNYFSCGSVAVAGHKDLKVIDKIPNALFIFDKEEIV